MWYCNNENCKNFKKEIKVDIQSWSMKTNIERKEETTCKECGEKLYFESPFPDNNFPSFNKFDSLSDSEKKALLKKRADGAMKKGELEYIKLEKQKKALRKMIK